MCACVFFLSLAGQVFLSQTSQSEQAAMCIPKYQIRGKRKNNIEKEGEGKAGTPLHLLFCSIQHTDFIQQFFPALYAVTEPLVIMRVSSGVSIT